jgi:branched-chain amino acid transport system ATP-binding protein
MSNGTSGGLVLTRVTAGYGATRVLQDVSFTLGRGEAVSIIGRNGVGKTTLLATIMGHTSQHAGSVVFDGFDLLHLPVYQRARIGIGYVPQEREIFPSLSVRENLQIGARPGTWNEAAVCSLFPRLQERLRYAGNQLSGGEQQMLAIARALMSNPTLLLMDEPSEGLAPVIVEELARVLATLRQNDGLSIVLVEHNTRVALAFARRVMVMDRGQIVYDGESAMLQQDPRRLEHLIGVTGASRHESYRASPTHPPRRP